MEGSESPSRYFKEIRRIKTLSYEEESLLIEKIRAGDNASKEKLIKANLRYVITIARRYLGKGLMLEDLINEGNLGLLYSTEKYDIEKKVRFLTYASSWIHKFIQRAIYAKGRMIHLPFNKGELLRKIGIAKRALEGSLEKIPCLDEIAEYLNIPEEDIIEVLKFSEDPLSFDSPFITQDKEELPLFEVLADQESKNGEGLLIENDQKETINKSLGKLTEKQRKVVQLYFGLEGEVLNLEEIADRLCISPERARQLKEAGIKKLQSLYIKFL